MSHTPHIVDRIALARNRAKATALFLHETARDDVQDRLAMVNRSFTASVVVTPFPQVWQGLLPNLRCIPDSETLDLSEGAQDLVIHAMALHWANDPVGQLIQCRRALRPDGLSLTVTLGGQTLHQLRACLAQAEADLTGGLSPRVAPMGEIRDLGALLQRAGFALPVADTFAMDVAYQSPLHLMHDLRAMGEGNALSSRLRHPTRRSVLLRAMQLYSDGFSDAQGRIHAAYEIVTLTGWSPADSQPRPLRPGSAAQRLADALKTRETPLKD